MIVPVLCAAGLARLMDEHPEHPGEIVLVLDEFKPAGYTESLHYRKQGYDQPGVLIPLDELAAFYIHRLDGKSWGAAGEGTGYSEEQVLWMEELQFQRETRRDPNRFRELPAIAASWQSARLRQRLIEADAFGPLASLG